MVIESILPQLRKHRTQHKSSLTNPVNPRRVRATALEVHMFCSEIRRLSCECLWNPFICGKTSKTPKHMQECWTISRSTMVEFGRAEETTAPNTDEFFGALSTDKFRAFPNQSVSWFFASPGSGKSSGQMYTKAPANGKGPRERTPSTPTMRKALR